MTRQDNDGVVVCEKANQTQAAQTSDESVNVNQSKLIPDKTFVFDSLPFGYVTRL